MFIWTLSKKCGKKILFFILVVVYNSDIQVGDLFMKRLFMGILAMTTLLLSSCGGKIVIKRYVCTSYKINGDTLEVTCNIKDGDYETTWVGFIDYWLVNKNISTNYWYELSGNEHALMVGVK